MNKPEDKIRINKFLANEGFATRNEIDTLIEKGKIIVNGLPATLGMKVSKKDKIELPEQNKKYKYFIYNKPVGIVTHSKKEGEKEIKDEIDDNEVYPVGRLDKASEGLIILTNDGRIVERLLSPEQNHDKEYIVSVRNKITPYFLKTIENGVNIGGGYTTKKSIAKIISDKTFSLTIVEGKKHQIRRMCAYAKNEVEKLKRIRIMNLKLGDLKSGDARMLDEKERNTLLKNLGLKN